MRIKVCGLSRPEDIYMVNEERPDCCGFILDFPKSRRSIGAERLGMLTALLDPGILPVGVFVDQSPERIAHLLNGGLIGAAQLHGHEDERFVRELRRLTARPIWQAFCICGAEDVKRAKASPADLVLLDAGRGGGAAFDWSLIQNFSRPFALAGGLNVKNLAKALETGASLLDVSGGVETGGVKDQEKVRTFIRMARTLAENVRLRKGG